MRNILSFISRIYTCSTKAIEKIADEEQYWIVFTENQLDQLPLSQSERKLNVIFPGWIRDYPQYNMINVLDGYIKCDNIFESLRGMFDELSINYGNEIIGYLNNCFTCSVRLISAYISAIGHILEKGKNSRFIFLYGIKFPPKGPNYFLSEYESHASRLFLYNRTEVLTMILVHYCQYRNAVYSFNTKSKMTWQKSFNIARVYTVWLGRFFISIKKSITQKEPESKGEVQADMVFITRSYAQTQILSNIIPGNGKKNVILVGSAFSEKKHYQTVKQCFKLDRRSSVIPIAPLKMGMIIKQYLAAFLRSIFVKRRYIEVHGFKIDLTQVVREILVSMPDLILYRVSLEETLKNISITGGLVIGTEMISPHAYVESIVAQMCCCKYIQLMVVDIERVSLPMPIVGSAFIPLTKQKYESLKIFWSEFQDKLFYPGLLIKQCQQPDLKGKYRMCYFSSYYNTKLGNQIIDYIVEYILKEDEKFLIKLHPRDQSGWYKSSQHASKFEIVTQNVNQSELFLLFDFALLGPSSVGTALLTAKKPFIFIDIHDVDDSQSIIIDKNIINGLDYIDNLYPVRILKIADLSFWFQNQEMLLTYFNQLYERIVLKKNYIITPKEFIKKIKNFVDDKNYLPMSNGDIY